MPQKLIYVKAGIKDADSKEGIVTGYFSHFGSIDGDGDLVMPGAFKKSISENGPESNHPRIKHLLNHSRNSVLGELTVLKEDSYGLYYESKIGTHALGVDFIKMVESKLITEHSIGYEVVKWRSHDSATFERWGNTYPVRELQELKLWEGSSLTSWGANANTPITGLKEYYAEKIPNLKSAIKNGTFTETTFGLLVEELELIEKALSDTTQPQIIQSTVPDEKGQYIKSINNFLLNEAVARIATA